MTKAQRKKDELDAVQMKLNELDCASVGMGWTKGTPHDEERLRNLCGQAAEMIRNLRRAYVDMENGYNSCKQRKDDYKALTL